MAMDHLPYPEDPAYPPLRVPYLVHDVYDDVFGEVGFDGYPEALGIDRENLTYEHYDADVLDPFLQEWVFFWFIVKGLRSSVYPSRPRTIRPLRRSQHAFNDSFSRIS